MRKIRVVVVEDSPTVRERLVEVLAADREIEVVAQADDGKAAIELCRKLRPDVMTVDMVLKQISGLAVIEYVMAYCPTPILIVSCSTNRGDLYKTYDALAAGAVDVLEKPNGHELDGEWEQALVSRVKLVSRIKVITHLRGRNRTVEHRFRSAPEKTHSVRDRDAIYRIAALGTSTGGPSTVLDILQHLPPEFPLPILLVIHIGERFGTELASWLSYRSPLPVSAARDGEPLPEVGRGSVILAPPGRHLMVSDGRLRLTRDSERHSCRPSVDVLFESLARELGPSSIGCLLTGMGKDGAEGLLAMRQAGARTLAQDEATSVVFGMPREAIRIGAAERVVPLNEIAPALVALAMPAARRAAVQ